MIPQEADQTHIEYGFPVPALGALTFLQSFVAGKANFCSHLASVVHFTVVKSQAILLIRLGIAEVISAVTLYLLPAFVPRWICSSTIILRVDSAYQSSL